MEFVDGGVLFDAVDQEVSRSVNMGVTFMADTFISEEYRTTEGLDLWNHCSNMTCESQSSKFFLQKDQHRVVQSLVIENSLGSIINDTGDNLNIQSYCRVLELKIIRNDFKLKLR